MDFSLRPPAFPIGGQPDVFSACPDLFSVPCMGAGAYFDNCIYASKPRQAGHCPGSPVSPSPPRSCAKEGPAIRQAGPALRSQLPPSRASQAGSAPSPGGSAEAAYGALSDVRTVAGKGGCWLSVKAEGSMAPPTPQGHVPALRSPEGCPGAWECPQTEGRPLSTVSLRKPPPPIGLGFPWDLGTLFPHVLFSQ